MSPQPSMQDDISNNTSQGNSQPDASPAVKPPRNEKKRSGRSNREGMAFWGAIIAALIGAAATIITTVISLQQDREIESLQAQLGQRNSLIQQLQQDLGQLENENENLKNRRDHPANPLEEILAQGSEGAQFEWQWAGENWYGRVTLQKQGNSYVITQAKVGLLEKNIEDRYLMNGQVLSLTPDTLGTFELTDEGLRIIELPVKKKDRRSSGEIRLTTVSGTLKQTLCYAGKVLYRDSGGQYQGDMVLVNYTPIFASQLDDWFLNEQAWFEEYYVDRDK